MTETLVVAARRWYRRPRWIVLMAVGAVLLAGGAFFAVAWSKRGAEEASVDEAVARFREDGGADGDDADANGGGEDALVRPDAGVYTYEGTGTEKLSLLSTGQEWGPNLPATVTHGEEGCWAFKIEYSTNHWQEWTYCLADDGLQEDGGRSFQSFDFVAFTVDDLQVFTCEPRGDTLRLDADAGDSFEQSCDGASEERGTHVNSAGSNTFVGKETVEVGGVEVDAYHYRSERSITGDQHGEEAFDTWYAADDGLPLKMERTVRVKSPSPLGEVVYKERGSFSLTSLEARR